ncbi:RagB/SusD family nutrient uptake outer membrane protein [Plebeiibacterium marinum]|uniref:RagB/SusD family nutrient uptake outer membrane protein n=1 Tax=Plebeiibacterium marinum TaxID=2992111 RepID=A0AAE3MDK7_9BACT|nr:RagB/SusD family nutrient uptake outer membrane protein [Plebeiobacterium marinum]MCW3805486.1 RagB/SusD family nutrient uptake outer membrane protein [Plebeiobacterium marinum]
MKKIDIKINNILIGGLTFFLLMMSGCSLEEDTYSIYTPDTFYSNEEQVLSSMSGIYRNFTDIARMGTQYRCMELSGDQVVVHGKIQGWWQNASFESLMQHTWDDGHAYIRSTYDFFFNIVGQANALIASLESSGLDDKVTGPIAELVTLRAYSYFYLMDLFGNVPIFTEEKVDPLNLPEQNTRKQVYDFVIAEIERAIPDLPAKSETPDSYYGRITKEAAYGILAVVYLNAEVYTGTADWDNVIKYTDLVINSGSYKLLDDYFDNFVYNNENNEEFIFGGVYTPDITGGLGHPLVQKVLPGISGGLFDLPYTPQNGFATRPSAYNIYEDGDIRRDMFLYYGELKDPRNGNTVMVEELVPDGNSVLYVEGKSTKGPVPYEIIPATGIRNQPMNAGIKWIKWGIDPNTQGGNAGNDIAYIRYADILLMKAEAYARKNDFSSALPLINTVRRRSNADDMESVTLEDVFEERSRELAFEMHRRRDLIRFNKFTDAWEFKEVSESFRNLFPIPNTALDANDKLKQNEGY